jgi:hypothetical protein
MASPEQMVEFADLVEATFVTSAALDELNQAQAAAQRDALKALRALVVWSRRQCQPEGEDPFSLDEQEEVLREVADRLGVDYDTDPQFADYKRTINEHRFDYIIEASYSN